MRVPLVPGDAVQTPHGKGIVREARGGGRYLVEIGGKGWVVEGADLAPLGTRKPRAARPARAGDADAGRRAPQAAAREVDLHGLTVPEALDAALQAVNDALGADCRELRLIHGRSGGRLRAALHQRLPGIAAVRGFRLDPRNPGVTIVSL